jgi:hypothetical protein
MFTCPSAWSLSRSFARISRVVNSQVCLTDLLDLLAELQVKQAKQRKPDCASKQSKRGKIALLA